MFYPLPKKIQLATSQAKWALASAQSVLLLVGLDDLEQHADFHTAPVYKNVLALSGKAKALDIPIIRLNEHDPSQAMMNLGRYLTDEKQLIVAGFISAQSKHLIDYLSSVTPYICVVNDAILLAHLEQHIQWIENITQLKIHHVNTYSLMRLWMLSAPKALVLSAKGVLLALAEHLDMEPLKIDPTVPLNQYGLDSVAIVSLVGLWRANGANIQYEEIRHATLQQVLNILHSYF